MKCRARHGECNRRDKVVARAKTRGRKIETNLIALVSQPSIQSALVAVMDEEGDVISYASPYLRNFCLSKEGGLRELLEQGRLGPPEVAPVGHWAALRCDRWWRGPL